MSRSRSLLSIVFAILFGVLPLSAAAQSFTQLGLDRVSPPDRFENSICFELTYLKDLDGKPFEVFPGRAEKEQDLDLILAQVVRRVITEEYEDKGKYLDETNLQPSTPQEIRHLVGTGFVTPAWGKAGQREMALYLQQNSNFLKLYKLEAYLDYKDDKGSYCSGLDVNPVLFRFGMGQQRDRVTIVFVRQTDE
ncbi:MAG: hypothetical protein GX442_21985 [Candidatus Riflebacteria bacterium]|nr:hypothetical protein [Candidatus Riflebacteria bacterium]